MTPWWVFLSLLSPAYEFEEAKGEEARKEHLASLVNSVHEEVKYRWCLLACVHAILRVRGEGNEG